MAAAYIERVNKYMKPYLAKNGYTLIRTEFVSEDHNWYLRMYIDLTEEEIEKRKATLEAEQAEEELNSEADDAAGGEAPVTADSPAATETAAGEEETDEEAGPEAPGVSINDCVKVSRYLSKWLDKEDFIKEIYTLEVCSKGFLTGQTEGES